jgi:hypothetical protein
MASTKEEKWSKLTYPRSVTIKLILLLIRKGSVLFQQIILALVGKIWVIFRKEVSGLGSKPVYSEFRSFFNPLSLVSEQ